MLARDVVAGRKSLTQEEADEQLRLTTGSDLNEKGTAESGRHKEDAIPETSASQVKLPVHTKSEPTAAGDRSPGIKPWREEATTRLHKAASLLAGLWRNVDETWASSTPQWLERLQEITKCNVVHLFTGGLVIFGLAALVNCVMGMFGTTLLARCCPYRCGKASSSKASQGNKQCGLFDWRFAKGKDPELERTNLMLLMPVMWGQVNSVR